MLTRRSAGLAATASTLPRPPASPRGHLPLAAILAALPPDIILGVEAPSAEHAHLPPVERARLCGESTRAFLATLPAPGG
ncbi:hypothetical protein SAMN02745194_01613 [Roseomonas rosea]|uniref:Uncharacterized protein n=1 Tax=Muricoccus roseus TaxID=198092 RepID=A0A1M6G523_9PROT|nr:hypothetical protein [Roseomonas rosea]SHJ05003.1 hypothetical protein SAMN02745194_01613 [Roseomonas rosea]